MENYSEFFGKVKVGTVFPTRFEFNFTSSPLVSSVVFTSSPLISSVVFASFPLVSSVVFPCSPLVSRVVLDTLIEKQRVYVHSSDVDFIGGNHVG